MSAGRVAHCQDLIDIFILGMPAAAGMMTFRRLYWQWTDFISVGPSHSVALHIHPITDCAAATFSLDPGG
jgi:hypothetical protein